MWRILSCALILALAAFGLPGAQPALGATKNTYIVTTIANSGAGSLRQAILDANAHAGADTITFDIPGCVSGICTITPATALPILIDNAGVTIDGYTQSGAAYATADTPAALRIELDGSSLLDNPANIGIGMNSANNIVRGLAIHSFPSYGILIGEVNAADTPTLNVISGNFIGTDIYGHTAKPNWSGVGLANDATLNTIGGDAHAERNIISGNTYDGILIFGATADYNLVSGNYIGASAGGASAVANGRYGVWLDGGANHNFIGYTNVPVWRNVISGNGSDNVRLSGSGTSENGIVGNFIGTNAAGDNILGGNNGVVVTNGAITNYIGGAILGQGNLISGHTNHGIWLMDETISGTYIQGNYIGLNYAGTAELLNTMDGVHITQSADNFIGSSGVNSRNFISGNGQCGIGISGYLATANTVYGNYIGTNPAGTAAIPNGRDGVCIGDGADDNRIGGDDAGQGNLISGNRKNGVLISGAGTDDNLVAGNLIGLSADGLGALGNLEHGVEINIGAEYNIIGGNDLISGGGLDDFSRNVIAGNLFGQVYITEADNNQLIGNYIGTDITGMAGFATGSWGVALQNGADHNQVGDCDEFEGNLISGNRGHALSIGFGDSDYNTVGCNLIGVAIDEHTPLGNAGYGISIGQNASHNTVGFYNTIAYNAFDGVLVVGGDSDDNEITYNYIYNNTNTGIWLMGDANNNMPAPSITGATIGGVGHDDTVSGTACASCWVEVFANPTTDGEGMDYVGRVQATAGGAFTLNCVTLDYAYLTATAWRSGDGTSQFSAVFTAPFTFVYLPVISR